MSDRLTIVCPKCSWQFHAQRGEVKVRCNNPECGEVIKLAGSDAIDAERSAPARPPEV